MHKATNALAQAFSPKSLFFPIILMLLIPALMWLTFPGSAARTLDLYGTVFVRTFVWASWTIWFLLPPFGRVIHNGTTEDIRAIIALDAVPFAVFTVTIFLILARRQVPTRRAGCLAILWGAFLLQMMGAASMSVVAFAGD